MASVSGDYHFLVVELVDGRISRSRDPINRPLEYLLGAAKRIGARPLYAVRVIPKVWTEQQIAELRRLGRLAEPRRAFTANRIAAAATK